MRCRAALLPPTLACLLGAHPALGQFNSILHKVTSEIQKAKPGKIQDALKSASANDIAGAIKDKQKQVSRGDAARVIGSVKDAVKDAAGGGARGGAPVEVTTTTLPPGSQTAHVAEALKGTSVEKIAGNLRSALQDTTPEELAGKIRGAVGRPKELADQLLGKDTAHLAGALRDATAGEVVAAARDGAGPAPRDAARKAAEAAAEAAKGAREAARGAGEAVAGVDAEVAAERAVGAVKGVLDAVRGADVGEAKGLADTRLDRYKDALKDADVRTISDAVRNPSVDKVNRAIEKVRGVARPPAPGPVGEGGGGEGAGGRASSGTPAAAAALLLLAPIVLGGLYAFRRLTKPRAAGPPMLSSEGFDMHPVSQMSGPFFGGAGARDLQSGGSASNGFTRF